MHVVKVVSGPPAPDLSRYTNLDGDQVRATMLAASRHRHEADALVRKCGELEGSREMEGMTEAALNALEDARILEERAAMTLVQHYGWVVTREGCEEWAYAKEERCMS